MDRLSELLGNAVQFAYTCWDRIVLSGYIERLQRPENLIYFFHDVVGIDAIEPAVLEQRTNAYKAWVRRITDERGHPRPAPRHAGVRKEELVEPYYRRLKGAEGVACVLTSMEQGRTFVSYVPRWKVTQRRRQLSLHQGVSKTVPALLLVRARPGHGTDERAGRQLLSVQRHVLPQRSLVRCPGTDTRRRALPQSRQRLPGGEPTWSLCRRLPIA